MIMKLIMDAPGLQADPPLLLSVLVLGTHRALGSAGSRFNGGGRNPQGSSEPPSPPLDPVEKEVASVILRLDEVFQS